MIESVKLIECPRDAWQGLKVQIPTERKVEYLRALVTAGFRHIDAVSFVSPKAVPQMADSEQVLEQLGPLEDVEIIGIVVNEKGAERAIATGGVSTLGYPCSISETFLRRNQNQSPEENQAVLKRIKDRADEAGLAMVAYISMAFGNPYGDPWSEEKVAEAAKNIAAMGISSVSIADTVGAAEPELVRRVVAAVLRDSGECEVGVHMHSTRQEQRPKFLPLMMQAAAASMPPWVGLAVVHLRRMSSSEMCRLKKFCGRWSSADVKLPVAGRLSAVAAMNAAISAEFSG